MVTYDFFYKVSMAEQGGFGIWYEYLAKSRIFKQLHAKSVLIFGLPKKYSLGLDTLFFADNSEMHIVDDRKQSLDEYKRFAGIFSKKVKITYVKDLSSFKTNKKYDLLISTEVIQDNTALINVIKNLAHKILIFVPNSQCYAHPRISGLNSLSLKELSQLGKSHGLKIEQSGYVDCPPWPAGACLPKKTPSENKESIFLALVKRILTKITPLLSFLDNLYIPPWKQLNSHMVYCLFYNDK